MKLGKRLYHSTSILTIKLLALLILLILFLNLNFQTLTSDAFNLFVESNKLGDESKFFQVLNFHMKYPQEYIFFFLAVFLPAIYYGFIRGVSFFENGIMINKGLPFFNTTILYSQVEKFEIIHSRYFLSITHKETGDDLLFTVNNVDRVLALLDQNGIEGDLGIKAKKDTSAHVKLLLFFIISGVVMAMVQYSGFIRSLFQ